MSKTRAGLFPRAGPKASTKSTRPNRFIQEVITQTLVCKRNHSRFDSCGIQEEPAEAALTDRSFLAAGMARPLPASDLTQLQGHVLERPSRPLLLQQRVTPHPATCCDACSHKVSSHSGQPRRWGHGSPRLRTHPQYLVGTFSAGQVNEDSGLWSWMRMAFHPRLTTHQLCEPGQGTVAL